MHILQIDYNHFNLLFNNKYNFYKNNENKFIFLPSNKTLIKNSESSFINIINNLNEHTKNKLSVLTKKELNKNNFTKPNEYNNKDALLDKYKTSKKANNINKNKKYIY